MASFTSLSRGSRAVASPAVASRRHRALAVPVQAFATDSNGKQSVADINRLIGVHIKEAASHLGARRVWQSNAAIGKYVKAAAADAAAGKLKVKGQYKAPAAAAPAAAKK